MTDGNLIRLPYWTDSRQYYVRIRDLPWPVWLDSGFPESGGGRYDIIAADPYQALVCKDGVTRFGATGHRQQGDPADPLALLRLALG
ncbi:MAG: aminodeoxychorismate synthase component I, partial [Sedimenticolaceae bacterium]